MNISHYIEYFDSLSSIDLSECDRLNLVFQKMLKDFKLKGYSDVSIEKQLQKTNELIVEKYVLIGSNINHTALSTNIYFGIEYLFELVQNTVLYATVSPQGIKFIGDR
jgi:hypothetical protein